MIVKVLKNGLYYHPYPDILFEIEFKGFILDAVAIYKYRSKKKEIDNVIINYDEVEEFTVYIGEV